MDIKHSKMLIELAKNEKIIIECNKQLLEQTNEDVIQGLKNQIYRLKKTKTEYYLDNSKHLFSYYENKKKQKTPIKTTDFFNTNKPIKFDNNCEICGCEMVLDGELGRLICCGCHISHVSISSEYSTNHNETTAEYSYAYQRIHHFKEVIQQFQAKENTLITDLVFSKIQCEILKQRLELYELNTENIKDILKKLKLKHLYEHINYVLDKLGVPPPVFSIELENRLYFMFQQIQTPYYQVCPDDRTNFLHYHYVLAKLLTLCGEMKYTHLLSTIKSSSKLAEHNHIWKLICEKLGWKY
jgi:hypothetical protein